MTKMTTEIRTIAPLPVRLNLTPLAFHRYAAQYLDVARIARTESSGFSPVPYYLYGRSLELSLKAYLVLQEITRAQLKSRTLGHDLVRVVAKADELGLGTLVTLDELERREVARANAYYAQKDFEYANILKAVKGYPELPDMDTLDALAGRLLEALERDCLTA